LCETNNGIVGLVSYYDVMYMVPSYYNFQILQQIVAIATICCILLLNHFRITWINNKKCDIVLVVF